LVLDADPSRLIVGSTDEQYRSVEHTPETNLYQEKMGLFWMEWLKK
jgi:hypothetical protein